MLKFSLVEVRVRLGAIHWTIRMLRKMLKIEWKFKRASGR